VKCEEKKAAGLVSEADPTPKSHYVKYARRLQYGKNAEPLKEKRLAKHAQETYDSLND
jgi:hypothetical protein